MPTEVQMLLGQSGSYGRRRQTLALCWLYILTADHQEAELGEKGEDAGGDDIRRILALYEGILRRGVALITQA